MFFLPEPVAFRRIYGLEAYSRTSRESNHHRQSVSAVKNNALPTEPRGHLWCAGVCVLWPVICFNLLLWCLCGVAGSCWPLVVVVVSSSVALLVSAFGVWGCFGLARALALFPPCPARHLGLSSGAFWSSQFSAGAFLWVSGCICDGPVVMPVAWCVVTAWLLSSLLLMATKASVLCEALLSTPCCGCCSGALPSCTEVFALG